MNVDVNNYLNMRAVNLFRFLTELSYLKSKIIREVSEFDHNIWFDSLKHKRGCVCVEFYDDQTEEDPPKIWIDIKKPELKPPPPPSSTLLSWIDKDVIENSSVMLNNTALKPVCKVDVVEEKFTRIDYLFNHPEIQKEWELYIEKKWRIWAEEDKELRKVLELYNTLYIVYNKQQKFSENYELVIGVGLLSWLTPSGQRVERHLLTVKAELVFDIKHNRFIVQPPNDGFKVNIEDNMLEPDERPSPIEYAQILELQKKIGSLIWEKQHTFDLLNFYINSIGSTRGQFFEQLPQDFKISKNPVVSLSPSLILRKRTEQSFITFFKNVQKNIEDGEPLTNMISKLLGGDHVTPLFKSNTNLNNDHLYFPLPSNPEQENILKSIELNTGVVVQGPPGTGKSHTIVNLVCHLLAEGKRVLITSHTARALKVIKEKLNKEIPKISELCVNLLGEGTEAMKNMEYSIRSISSKLSTRDDLKSINEISSLEDYIRTLKEEEAIILRDLIDIRENLTKSYELVFGKYSGTTQQIAEMISREEPLYSWISCFRHEHLQAPFSNDEMCLFLKLMQEVLPNIQVIKADVVKTENIPTPEKFAVIIKDVEEQKLAIDSLKEYSLNQSIIGAEQLIPPTKLSELFEDESLGQDLETNMNIQEVTKKLVPKGYLVSPQDFCKLILIETEMIDNLTNLVSTNKDIFEYLQIDLATHMPVTSKNMFFALDFLKNQIDKLHIPNIFDLINPTELLVDFNVVKKAGQKIDQIEYIDVNRIWADSDPEIFQNFINLIDEISSYSSNLNLLKNHHKWMNTFIEDVFKFKFSQKKELFRLTKLKIDFINEKILSFPEDVPEYAKEQVLQLKEHLIVWKNHNDKDPISKLLLFGKDKNAKNSIDIEIKKTGSVELLEKLLLVFQEIYSIEETWKEIYQSEAQLLRFKVQDYNEVLSHLEKLIKFEESYSALNTVYFKKETNSFEAIKSIYSETKVLKEVFSKKTDVDNSKNKIAQYLEKLQSLQIIKTSKIYDKLVESVLNKDGTSYQNLFDYLVKYNSFKASVLLLYTESQKLQYEITQTKLPLTIASNTAVQDTIEKLNQAVENRDSINYEKICNSIINAHIMYDDFINKKTRYKQASHLICSFESSINNHILSENAHSIMNELKGVIRSRDLRNYKNIFDKIIHLKELQEKWNKANYILNTNLNVIQDYKKVIYEKQIMPNSNCINNLLFQAVEKLNLKDYCKYYDEVNDLNILKSKYFKYCSISDKYTNVIPDLVKAMVEDFSNQIWETRLNSLDKAWKWMSAKKWLDSLDNQKQIEKKSKILDQKRKEILRTLGSLAASKAWYSNLKTVNEKQRQHLEGWQLSIQKIGKDKGKRAPKYKEDARKHMLECSDAIPAWIMPLYRVVESMPAKKELFDYVIIDEASQSGPEAMLLYYLGKKIIIVGDDKQISPQFVGLKRDPVDDLINRYLRDYDFKDTIGIDNSFFDLSQICFPGKVVLREHFRCMPEIIHFSNKNFYNNNPLKPLRQFGSDRLTPTVINCFVKEGYNDNKKHNLNFPEAKTIASIIKNLCSDERYANKTIGVISLLGKDQANLIDRYLIQNIGLNEMEKHQIVCGDAYDFQGDERDVILLSMVKSPSDNLSALTGRPSEQRFNVAASRARDQIILVHSIRSSDIANPECLRRKMIEWFENSDREDCFSLNGIKDVENISDIKELKENNQKPPKPFDSWFEVEVFSIIKKKGYIVIPQYEIGGYRIDLVVAGKNNRIAIECDGDRWHGREQYESDMLRQRNLERCGWKFWRITGSAFYNDRENSLNSLWQELEKMEIFPSEKKKKTDIRIEAEPFAILEPIENIMNDEKFERKIDETSDFLCNSNEIENSSETHHTEINSRISGIINHPHINNLTLLNKSLNNEKVVKNQNMHSQQLEIKFPTNKTNLKREKKNENTTTHLGSSFENWSSGELEKMANWAQQKQLLENWERKLLYTASLYLTYKYKFSDKQILDINRIISILKSHGYKND